MIQQSFKRRSSDIHQIKWLYMQKSFPFGQPRERSGLHDHTSLASVGSSATVCLAIIVDQPPCDHFGCMIPELIIE